MNKFKTTKRKFYGKWLYKVSLSVPAISIIRHKQLDDIKLKLDSFNDDVDSHNYFLKKANKNKDDILRFIDFVSGLEKSEYAIRCESNIVDIYTNQKSIFESFIDKFNDIVRLAVCPDEKSIGLLTNQRNIVVKKYPHDRYRYKVFLQPHKNIDENTKEKFIGWLENQQQRVTFSNAVKDWFIKTNWNWDRRYILVEDEQTLIMMKLKNSDYVGSIYEYVVSDK
jgi:hypothetical protein